MLYKTIQATTLMLVVWMIFVTTHASSQIKTVRHLADNASQIAHSNSETLNALSGTIATQMGAAKAQEKANSQAASQLKSIEKAIVLNNSYRALIKVSDLAKSKRYDQAKKLLSEQKKPIWNSGLYYSKHKKALHALMGNIDNDLKELEQKSGPLKLKISYQAISKVLDDINKK